jgi:hypothetical protein
VAEKEGQGKNLSIIVMKKQDFLSKARNIFNVCTILTAKGIDNGRKKS